MTPGNRCTYTTFIDSNLTHSEWGLKIFSLSMGGDFAKNNWEAQHNDPIVWTSMTRCGSNTT